MATIEVPELRGDAKAAVNYRGGHLQIIASAGSGKTEVVSQRVASLLADQVPPEAIVAFTFTERAAESLKSRIETRIAALKGVEFLARLNGMFVGTIHSYCFRVLQQHVPRYETFDVLDEHRLTAFLTRMAKTLEIKKLDSKGRLFASIKTFVSNVGVVENELINPERLEDPFREIYEKYCAALQDHRFLTYGQIIAGAVRELRVPETFDQIHGTLRHLIVDEYQDINPAQEALIERLAEQPVHVCVVGDDDQSIYQWRGSDVSNIVSFEKRYGNVKPFKIQTNRRSRPDIIGTANGFVTSIEGRLPKSMDEHRPASGHVEVECWSAETPEAEGRTIAKIITAARKRGYHYRDIAILCRGRVSIPAVLQGLHEEGIPVQPGGRTNLFLQPEAQLFARTLCWLADMEWRPDAYHSGEEVTVQDLVRDYAAAYDLDAKASVKVAGYLKWWSERVDDLSGRANLVREYYDLVALLGTDKWDLDDPWSVNRLGTLARCSQVLADYESTRLRTRPDLEHPGEMKGAQNRGEWYYKWLAIYVLNWAQGAYEGFEGEEEVELDAVDLTTIHQAKGLEWPLVFVPALTSQRFPTSNTGKAGAWHIPANLFNATRYEGSENDERRLFYVAITRAREFLSLSTFEHMKNAAHPSPFLDEVADGAINSLKSPPKLPPPEPAIDEDPVVEITFSDLAAYLECGFSYRYRRLIGFQPPLAPEIGYGRAVHHVLRRLADFVREHGKVPTAKQLDRLFNDEFYMPAANKAGYQQMKALARQLVDRYVSEWESDLHNVWAVERPFELHLGDATISGRADVIIKEVESGPDLLSIVDYKTATDGHDSHDFQLQVYTDAGRREGLNVEGAFVHDLRNAERIPVPVGEQDVAKAEAEVKTLVVGLRTKEYLPKPGPICHRCDVRALCRHRAD